MYKHDLNLVKPTIEAPCYCFQKGGVRHAFIHFLIAFLIENHYPTICSLLDKKGLLISIMSGMKFDTADDVCMVMAMFKTSILENPSVGKTQKMKLFNTQVVKDIINLYNWKGLEGLKNKSITVSTKQPFFISSHYIHA